MHMAKVWFVRRRGTQWIAPGGAPVVQAPLADLIFKLDLGPQRWLARERPQPVAEAPREDPGALTKVMIETAPDDLAGLPFTTYKVGCYDSPYPPREAMRRLGLASQ